MALIYLDLEAWDCLFSRMLSVVDPIELTPIQEEMVAGWVEKASYKWEHIEILKKKDTSTGKYGNGQGFLTLLIHTSKDSVTLGISNV